MGSELDASVRICPVPPGSKKGLNWHLRPRRTFMAVGVSLILTSTGFISFMMQSAIPPGPWDDPDDPFHGPWGRLVPGTPHGPIAIDGDASFSDTALLEGWPGDGSPRNPYIIDGLDIDLEGNNGSCISISNTQVSFIISNCILTGACGEQLWHGDGAGIFLRDVTNSDLVKNILQGNRFGIGLWLSDSNTVANNTCFSNTEHGIFLLESDYNTVANNTCSSNSIGIEVGYMSKFNKVADNTCNSNILGIQLAFSQANTVNSNTCWSNTEQGIFLLESDSNRVVDNTCSSNRIGIEVGYMSKSNTVSDNTCDRNGWFGIYLVLSNSSTVDGNTCRNNDCGIVLAESDSNTVVNNLCYNNRIGINIDRSYLNMVVQNTFHNPDTIIVLLLLFGLAGIIFLGAGWRMTYEASRWPGSRQEAA